MAEPKTSDLIGKVLVNATELRDGGINDSITLEFADGSVYRYFHSQDCCETVEINDVCGEWSSLYGGPLLVAEERESDNVNPEGVEPPEYQDSFTWTFYTFRTVGGTVTVRWHGDSNGYYSESVDLACITEASK